MNEKKLFIKIMNNLNNVDFNDFVRILNKFGFKLNRVRGSHNIYVNSKVDEIINIQNVNGKAKSYQIKQFFRLVEKYNLEMED